MVRVYLFLNYLQKYKSVKFSPNYKEGPFMKKYLVMALFCLFLSTSLFAMGRLGNNNSNNHKANNSSNNNVERRHHNRGGSGVPEPASLLLILGGGAAAYGIKKAIKK